MIGFLVMATSLMATDDLAAAAARFAGRPVVVDARLALAACAAPGFAMAGERVEVRCMAPAWRVFLPVAGGADAVVPTAVSQFRRGERIMVLVEGAGFEVVMAAVVDGDAGGGRLWVKPLGGKAGGASGRDGEGRRLLARVREDGRVVIGG